jgi:hypothetical protein
MYDGDRGPSGQVPQPDGAIAAGESEQHPPVSGSSNAAIAFTGPVWPSSGLPTGVPVTAYHNRTVSSVPPEASSTRPSGNGTAATAFA